MIPVYQLGWMAGIVDMKGRILRKKNRTRATPQITLAVETKEVAVIKGLARMTGTNPEFQPQRPLVDWMQRACVEHCPESHIHHFRDGLNMPPTGRWTISGAAMVVVLENLAPFLTIDRGYDLAIAEVRVGTVFTGQGSAAIIRALRRLEALDWELPEDFAEALKDLEAESTVEEVVAA